MNRAMMTTAAAIALLGAGIGASAAAQMAPAPTPTATPKPMASAPPVDQATLDARRHGPEILTFAGVKKGGTVIDLVPGSGYWTKLFAAAVGPAGHVYGVFPEPMAAMRGGKGVADYRAMVAPLANVTVAVEPAAAVTAPMKADLIFTSQNYHDYLDPFMGPVDMAAFNESVFAALKPGGVFVVVDHAAEAGSGLRDTDTLHRIDPAAVKAQVTAAGFTLVGESKLLANPADDHSLGVFKPEIRGHTDQFIYKFRKPG